MLCLTAGSWGSNSTADKSEKVFGEVGMGVWLSLSRGQKGDDVSRSPGHCVCACVKKKGEVSW